MKLGQAWYLYFYILDNADWDTGAIAEWKDEYAAQDLEKPLGMIREHRKRLADEGYITCEKGRHDQKITVHNWTNPRRYDGEVLNVNPQSAEINELSEVQSTGKDELSFKSECQSTGQSTGQSVLEQAQIAVPSYSHSITESQNHNKESTAAVFRVYEQEIGLLTAFISERLKADIDDYTEGWVVDAIKTASESNVHNLKYVEAILQRWKTQGKDRRKKKKSGWLGQEGAMAEMEKKMERDRKAMKDAWANATGQKP